MRILICSNSPYETTGYGQQAKITAEKFSKEGYKVGFFANYCRSPNGHFRMGHAWLPVYRPPSEQPEGDYFFGLDEAIEDFRPDLVLFLADPWAIKPYTIAQARLIKGPVFAWWYPCDSEPLPSPDVPNLNQMDFIIPMSMHGANMLFAAEYSEDEVVAPIPHALDMQIWGQPPQRDAFDEYDGYRFGMVQANFGTRKMIALQMEAFAMAARDYPGVKLFMFTDLKGVSGGVRSSDYTGLVEWYDLTDRVLTVDKVDIVPEQMPSVFDSFDCLLHCTSGEGFGVPIIEAMARGKPCIVTDNSAMQNFQGPTHKVEPSFKEFIGPKLSFYSWPSAERIAEAIDHFIAHDNGQKATWAKDEASKYDIDFVYHQSWEPFFNTQVKETLDARRSRN